MSKASILYVEDDAALSFVTRDNLELLGYEIDHCTDGEQAIRMFREKHYHLCILDVMLPKMDGFEVATTIRKINQDIPIIFLTARSTKEDKLKGLRLGGDDYIIKPFSIEELVLKIEIFLRRSSQTNQLQKTLYTIGRYVLDVSNQQLKLENNIRKLTSRETELLKMFCLNANNILKREDLLLNVWGDDNYFASRSLDVFISRLRKYLKDDPQVCIENIHNVGFRLNVSSEPRK